MRLCIKYRYWLTCSTVLIKCFFSSWKMKLTASVIKVGFCVKSNFACWVIFHAFCWRLLTFFKINFTEKFFHVYHQCQNSLDPYQARHFVRLIWVQTVCKCYQQTTLFSKSTFPKNSFMNTIRVSNSLDQDQARNCLQMLSADNTRRQKF